MTLPEALRYFDEVRPLYPAWHVERTCDLPLLVGSTSAGEDIGVPYCCGLPVVKNSQDGVERISCSVCKTAIQYVTGYGWMVAYFAYQKTAKSKVRS